MGKAYLTRETKDPDYKKNKKYYDFDSRPGRVERYWTTKESAEHACDILNSASMHVTVQYPDGSGTRICHFQIEKQPTGLFYLFFEVPFIPQPAKGEGAEFTPDAAIMQKPDNTGCKHVQLDGPTRKTNDFEYGFCASCQNQVALKLNESGRRTGESWIVES